MIEQSRTGDVAPEAQSKSREVAAQKEDSWIYSTFTALTSGIAAIRRIKDDFNASIDRSTSESFYRNALHHIEQGDFERAEYCLLECLDRHVTLAGSLEKPHQGLEIARLAVSCARTTLTLQRLYECIGKDATDLKSVELASKSCTMALTTFGALDLGDAPEKSERAHILGMLSAIAEAYLERKDYREALATANVALLTAMIYADRGGVRHKEIVASERLRVQERFADAILAKSSAPSWLPMNREFHCAVLGALEQRCFSEGKFEEAGKFAAAARSLMIELLGPDARMVGTLSYVLGCCLEMSGDHKGALEALLEAQRIHASPGPMDNTFSDLSSKIRSLEDRFAAEKVRSAP